MADRRVQRVSDPYARRPPGDLVADAGAYAYAYFYGLHAVFVDQVPSGSGDLPHYRRLVGALRERVRRRLPNS